MTPTNQTTPTTPTQTSKGGDYMLGTWRTARILQIRYFETDPNKSTVIETDRRVTDRRKSQYAIQNTAKIQAERQATDWRDAWKQRKYLRYRSLKLTRDFVHCYRMGRGRNFIFSSLSKKG